jgi:prepilin-type N-terminal cleavage/methylation domain-containing protein
MKRMQSGFSLIEVLVSMVIFAIVSLAISSLMIGSMAQISKNALASEAIALAQGQMEDLRNISFANIQSNSYSAPSAKGNTTFTVSWVVANNTPAAGAAKINLSVNWIHKGAPQKYELETIFTAVSPS